MTPLKDMPLVDLYYDFKPEHDLTIVQSISTLKSINGKSAAEYLKELAAKAMLVKKKREPIPDGVAQAKAEKTIKDLYNADFAKLKTAADRTALAAKLTQIARETNENLAVRFVLLREARDLAALANDVTGALQVIDQLAETYAIDVPDMKLTILAKAYKTAATAALNQVLTENCLAVLEEAIAADNYDIALRLLAIAEAASKKAGVAVLVNRAQAAGLEMREAQKEYAQAQAAAETSLQKPDNPDANLVRGRYLCRRKGDWEQGLPLLAMSADPILRDLAQKDLETPTEATKQSAVGDGWWDLATKEQGMAKLHLLRRAHTWYQRALPELSELAKANVEKRIAEVETILTASLPHRTKTVTIETDPIKEKLDKSKADYRSVVDRLRKQMLESLEKAETAAQQAGNKKAVDQIRDERAAFEKDGKLPTKVATKEYQQQLTRARAAHFTAYKSAIGSYTKTKMDVQADALKRNSEFIELCFWQGVDQRVSWEGPTQTWFRKQANGKWREGYGTTATFTFTEIGRTAQYVDLYDGPRKIGIRLFTNRCSIKRDYIGQDWAYYLAGAWK